MKPAFNNRKLPGRNCGSSMIEVLVTIVILVIGLLGLVGLQLKTQQVELESHQRVQAVVILSDMVSRLQANRDNPDAYIAAGEVGDGNVEDCSVLEDAALDLCDWGNALRGAGESSGGTNVGAMIGARGCIAQIQAQDAVACIPGIYEVTVTWQGLFGTVAPNNLCAQGQYGDDDTLRRAISIRVAAGTGGCT